MSDGSNWEEEEEEGGALYVGSALAQVQGMERVLLGRTWTRFKEGVPDVSRAESWDLSTGPRFCTRCGSASSALQVIVVEKLKEEALFVKLKGLITRLINRVGDGDEPRVLLR